MDLKGAFLDLKGALLQSLPESGGAMAPLAPPVPMSLSNSMFVVLLLTMTSNSGGVIW